VPRNRIDAGHFLVAIEFSGWLLEESDLNDPRYGKGISQIFLMP